MWEPRVETKESAREPLVDPEAPTRADPFDLNLSGEASEGEQTKDSGYCGARQQPSRRRGNLRMMKERTHRQYLVRMPGSQGQKGSNRRGVHKDDIEDKVV